MYTEGDKVRMTNDAARLRAERGCSAAFLAPRREGGRVKMVVVGQCWTSLAVEHASGKVLWMPAGDVERAD